MPQERTRVLAPAGRVRSFKEVVLGLGRAEAVENAKIYLERERALKGRPCPLGTDHPAVLRLVAKGDRQGALALLLKTNPFPEVTGRLCPEIFEETLCQNRRGDRVSLRAIERYLADNVALKQISSLGSRKTKVAVIGSGPAGLSAAWTLAGLGYSPTVYEAAPFPGGTFGYRFGPVQLPPKVLQGILRRFKNAGIAFLTDFLFGRAALPAELLEQGFGAVLVATGVSAARPLGITGEGVGGVIPADVFLKAVNWRAEDPELWLGRKVIVVGEIDPAFAVARTAIRLGRKVTVVVRGPETHVQANPMFVRHAVEEGIQLKAFTSPVGILAGPDGCVQGIVCRYLDYRMDNNGRMVMVADGAGEFTLDADTVITAGGWEPDTLFLRDIPGLEFNADGSIRTKPESAATALPGIFAAGGVVEPDMSLTDTILAGTRAAQEIDEKLKP